MRRNPVVPLAELCITLGLVSAVACSGGAPETTAFAAINNGNAFEVDSVTLSGAGEAASDVVFEELLADSATAFRDLTFEDLSVVHVSCASDGCLEGTVALTADSDNTIFILKNAPPVVNVAAFEPLAVTALSPAEGATGVGLNASLSVTFLQPVQPSTVTTTTDGSSCAGSVQLSADDFATCVTMSGEPSTTDEMTYALVPDAGLTADTTYLLKLSIAIRGVDHSALPDEFVSAGFATGAVSDEVPPANIDDLIASSVDATTVTLAWTAVGDDGTTGTAQAYDVRHVQGACPLSFASAEQASGEPAPQAAGTPETFTVEGLASATEHCFAVVVADEIPNRSAPSNAVEAATTVNVDTTPPGVATLTVDNATSSSLRVSWTAVGDDGEEGTASAYELRRASAGCPAHDGESFSSGTVVLGMPAPLPSGTPQSKGVSGLSASTTYCFILRVADELGNATFSASKSGTTADGGGFW